jgi:endoglycosylceramidase
VLGTPVVLVLAALLTLAWCVPAGATDANANRAANNDRSEPVGDLSHVGRWLTDASGRVVMLHGVNMVEKDPPYYPSAFGFDNADAAWLQSNGLNVVRLGVLATGLMPSPGHISERYLNHLASTVKNLDHHGIYVLLDLHQDGFGPTVGSDGFPSWMTVTGSAVNNHIGFPLYYLSDPATQQAFQSLWDNVKGPNAVRLQTDVATMMHALAHQFAESTNVIGYDVFNEPWPGTTWSPCLSTPSGCPTLDHTELDPLYTKVDRAIRSAGSTQLVFGEPFSLFNYGTARTTIRLPGADPASGLSFHQYATDTAHAESVLVNAQAWSARTGGALLNTEWGATTDGAAITTQADQFDQALIPWIFWAFTSEAIANPALPPSGSNVVASTVDALVRPYPTAIAGTPTSISYDSASHAFVTSWSTITPTGEESPAGATTTIAVPRLDYPSGYSVSVTGAGVTSAPCAGQLTLVADPGVSSVTVRVSARARCDR